MRDSIKSSLYKALTFVRNDGYCRLCPSYSILLAAMVWVLGRWPTDADRIAVLVEHLWLRELVPVLNSSALVLAVALGLVGILRQPLLAKLTSAAAIALGSYQLWQWNPWPSPLSYLEFIWIDIWSIAFELPISLIGTIAYENETLARPFYALYLFGVWLIARLIITQLWHRTVAVRKRILARFPRAAGLLRQRHLADV